MSVLVRVPLEPSLWGDEELAARVSSASREILSVMLSVSEDLAWDRRCEELCDEYDRDEADRDCPRWWCGC
jgi:hypothetical protein